MEFAPSRPDVVVGQTALAVEILEQAAWLQADAAVEGRSGRGAHPAARHADVPRCRRQWREPTPRLLIRFLGQRIAQSYGADFCGRFLDEAIPPAWRENAMRTCGQAVTSRLPVYNVVDTGDAEGKIVHMERLLLPFTSNGALAGRLLASIETLSLEGRFEQRELGHSPHASQSCALVAVIDPDDGAARRVHGR